jgi:hypothetical protein
MLPRAPSAACEDMNFVILRSKAPACFSERKFRIYKAIILSVILYTCIMWSLTLKEEHDLPVFKNTILRKKCCVREG